MKSNKYTIVCEGQTEMYLFQELKTTIFENKKIQQCKKHKPKVIKGTINTNSYIDGNDCCIVFYLIDEDELKSNEIFKHKQNIQNKNGKLIISKPCLEIILLAIFENVINNPKTSKKDVYDKLTKSLISNKIINKDEKYSKTSNIILEKIIKFLKRDEKCINDWINNISKLRLEENNIEFNNFNLIIKFLRSNNE